MELDLGIVSIMDFYYYIDYPYNCIDVFRQKVIINSEEKKQWKYCTINISIQNNIKMEIK